MYWFYDITFYGYIVVCFFLEIYVGLDFSDVKYGNRKYLFLNLCSYFRLFFNYDVIKKKL